MEQKEQELLGGKTNKKTEAKFDAKKMLTDNVEKKTKIRYNDRLKVEIVKQTRFYKKGQIINPHKVKGLALIEQGIAKKVTEKD